jgi:PHD/YefM family antitoxin component YafN of YafNO toxin-antitoxin module
MGMALAKTEEIGYTIFRLTEEANTMPNIQPSTIMGTHYNDISAFCNENREPMFITKNGQGDLAVMSIEMFDTLSGRQELYRLLDEGRADALAGRTQPYEEVFAEIEQEIMDGRL